MSASRLALPLTLFLVGCGSDPPGAVAHEAQALDFTACLRGDASCITSGEVHPSEAMFAGEHDLQAYGKDKPATISLPLLRVTGGKKLRWLAFGVRVAGIEIAKDEQGKPIFGPIGMTVTIDGFAPIVVEPNWGFTRVEVDTRGVEPAPNARVTLSVMGQFDFVYSAGRWDE